MFLIVLTYKKSLDIIDKFLVAHRDYLDKIYAKKELLVSGPQNPRTGGVIISLHETRAEVEEFIKHDPFYQHDLADYEIIEFNPVKQAPGLATIIEH